MPAQDAQDADDDLDELVHRGDLDGLVRLVDARCASRDWAGLRRLRDRSRAALDTGRQLWPVATLAEYRLALLAPDDWAAGVVDVDSGRFTIGPLSEVVAQHHTWAGLRPHLVGDATSVYVAHERSLRGEAIDPAELAGLPPVLDIPVDLATWEPEYALAEYRDLGADFPTPPDPGGPGTEWTELVPIVGAPRIDDGDTELAFRALVDGWTAGSTGRAELACVEGEAAHALGALGLRHARVAPITGSAAIAWLAWAGAGGGANGRRRGAATGRSAAWWLLGALGHLHDEWPPAPDAVEELLADLRWWWWDAHEPVVGWSLRLVVEDHGEHLAWAFHATDAT